MILHVDMDAFYASVEERENPDLLGKPVVVGGSAEGRGVVCAANYAARKFGIHSAMSAAQAVRLCPQAVFIRPRMNLYAEISGKIREIFDSFTPLVEPLSLDEAFLDVTGSEPHFGPSPSIGRQIKDRIRRELRLVASVGIAPNKFIAKIASDLEKPDGFVVVDQNEVLDFLEPLPISRLWGVGKVTAEQFTRLGIRTIGELRKLSPATLGELFGTSGEHYWQLAHGIDDRPVVPDREAKSISNETTFSVDIADAEILKSWLMQLVEQVARRLRQHGLQGRTAEIKVRFANFKTISRSITLDEPTNITQELLAAAFSLLDKKVPANHLPVRLLGFGVHGFDHTGRSQRQLFDETDRQRGRALDRVADQIVGRFGKSAIRRSGGHEPHRE